MPLRLGAQGEALPRRSVDDPIRVSAGYGASGP